MTFQMLSNETSIYVFAHSLKVQFHNISCIPIPLLLKGAVKIFSIYPVKLEYIICTSVGSNPKVTSSELFRTLEVELRTLPNPSSPTKTELRTHPNPPKILNSEPTNWVRPNTIYYYCMGRIIY